MFIDGITVSLNGFLIIVVISGRLNDIFQIFPISDGFFIIYHFSNVTIKFMNLGH